MTLEVVTGDKRVIYADESKLPVDKWRKMLGLAAPTIGAALFRQGLHSEKVPSPFPGQPDRVLIPIGQFPYIIRGLAMVKIAKTTGQEVEHRHLWAANVDTTSDFQVVTPKGTKLVYTYPVVGWRLRLKQILQFLESKV